MEPTSQTPYATKLEKLSELAAYVGQELGLTDWVEITQERIDQFAIATGDEQWIHVDVDKSKQFSPYGQTVAHGFMILSFASKFSYETFSVGDVVMGVNYGLNKVRFPNATLSDAKVRGRVSLLDFQPITQGARYIMKVVFEIEGQKKPACVAEFIAQAYTA